MSYPKNAATPPRIAVGAVVQISDGAVQTSGVSIRVVPQGGSAAAGLGTTSYEDGIVLYAPTQAETNYEAFVVIAYKTGCIPASTTIVTSDTATAGRVRLSGETHSGATIPTVTAVTNRVNANTDQWDGVAVTGMPMPTYTQPTGFLAATFPTTVASPTNITSASGVTLAAVTHTGAVIPTVTSVTNAVTAGTVSDKTGYSLSASGLASITSWSVAITGNITGNLSGSVGSVTGAVGSVTSGVTVTTNNDKTGYSLTQAFPANFANLGINASGHISRVVLVDTCTANTDMRGTDNAALASVWTSTVAGRIDAAISSRSSHSAADVWSVATRTLTAFSFSVTVGTIASNAITAAALAADAGAEIASAVRSELATELARIDAATSSRSSHSAADVWAVATRTLTAFSFSVTVGTNNDKTGYSLATAPLDASGTAAAVWGALLASYTTAGTFGARILRTDSASAGNGAKVTAAGHVAADIHELQPAVIEAQHFALGAIDANALAADASSEIATAVRAELATELARINVPIDSRLATIAYTAPPSATTIADTVLGRSVSNVEATASEHSVCTLVLAALESSVIGTSWTIKRTDGTTTHATKTVTTDASAEPITGVT